MISNLHELAAYIREFALLLELNDENAFKVRAHQRLADALEEYDGTVDGFLEQAASGKIKGVGEGLIVKIKTLFADGQLDEVNQLRRKFPSKLLELLELSGLGPKKLIALRREIGIESIDELRQACIDGRVAKLKGFGSKTAERFLAAIALRESFAGKILLSKALQLSASIIDFIVQQLPYCQIEASGELRRCLPVISSLNFVCAGVSVETLEQVISEFSTTNSARQADHHLIECILSDGTPVKVVLCDQESLQSILLLSTGSAEHIESLKQRGLGRLVDVQSGQVLPGSKCLAPLSESEIYKLLELAFIEPELRDSPAIVTQAAECFASGGELPDLVRVHDLCGILHVHSTYSDGRNSLREMAEAARAMGMQYLGICDHSRSAAYAGGLSIDKVFEQHREIDRLNSQMEPFIIFKGIESDILPDGSLDYPEDVLKCFDFVVASVHSSFNMGREQMTERVLRAVENRYTTILGHPTGRLLLERPGYQIDIDRILQSAAAKKCTIEFNCNPYRLDLDWQHLQRAVQLGLKIPISPDAHSASALNDVRLGVRVARKAQLTAENVLNCLSAEEINRYFIASRG